MKGLRFFLSHSIFVAICAVALCFQTAILFKIKLSAYLYLFIFFSTLCSYNFYWQISAFYFLKLPYPQFFKKFYSNTIFFFIGLAGVFFLLPHLVILLPVIAIGLLLTLLYTLPLLPFKCFAFAKNRGFFKTFLLAFTWAFVTVYIPYQQSPSVPLIVLQMVFSIRFLFMLMLCIIFDARDTKIDTINGLQSPTTFVKPIIIKGVMTLVFVGYWASSMAFNFFYFPPLQIVAQLITGVFTAIIYWLSLKKQGYIFYYFWVDGLMLFSAIATYMATI